MSKLTKRKARQEAAQAADSSQRALRVARVLYRASASAASAERKAKASQQKGRRMLLEALRLLPPDEREEAIAAALRGVTGAGAK